MDKTVGIFLIATGKYIDFVQPLCEDLGKFFLTSCKKTVYVFTDAETIPACATKVYQEHQKWPYPTLFRYHIISKYCKENNIVQDYYYYLDVDMRVVDVVGEEILGDFVGVCHPGFFKKSVDRHPHNTNFFSRAYSPSNKIKKYYAGGFNGGSRYLEMAEKIVEWVDIDQMWGYTPEWHDESYLNRYFTYFPPSLSLDPSYCYPQNSSDAQEWRIADLKPKIICLFKPDKYLIEK